jgi:hypothetical protein
LRYAAAQKAADEVAFGELNNSSSHKLRHVWMQKIIYNERRDPDNCRPEGKMLFLALSFQTHDNRRSSAQQAKKKQSKTQSKVDDIAESIGFARGRRPQPVKRRSVDQRN